MPSVAIHPPKTPVTKGSNAIAAATVPNVCKMPGPPAPFVPAPLPNIGKSGMSPSGYSTTVKIEGNAVAIQGSSFKSMGDTASKGTGGGMVSMNVEGATKFIAPGSLTVKIQGKNVHLLSDVMSNNGGPSGSPPNAATLAGAMQIPKVVFAGDLNALADECNKKTNEANGHCPGGPSGADCTTLGTAKHKCCENAIKEAGDPNYESEVAFDENLERMGAGAESAARSAANAAYHAAKTAGEATKGVWAATYFGEGGASFKADVLVHDGEGGVKGIDFKFNCKDAGTPDSQLMKNTQRDKYKEVTGKDPKIIHKDGRKC